MSGEGAPMVPATRYKDHAAENEAMGLALSISYDLPKLAYPFPYVSHGPGALGGGLS